MERVLHVVTYMGRGGIETMLMNYYRSMDRNLIQFDFLVHRDFCADYDDEIERLGGRIYRIPPMNPASAAYQIALQSFFEEHSYRVVHCHLNYMSGVVLAAAKKAGVPIRISHAHTASMAPGWKQYARRICKTIIPFTATCRFACSCAAGRAVFGSYPFQILANSIDAKQFRYDETVRVIMRDCLNLVDAFTIMHVGRFSGEKNHDFLLDAFSELLKVEPNAKLVLVGDGELRSTLERKAERFPVDSIQFLGVRNDVAQLLQAADVFVFPSKFEGLPVTMIEAQAAGLPCVMSDAITDECIVTDLVTTLPLGDPKRWAQEILKKRNIPRKDRFDDIVKSGYDITTAANKLENFYLNGDAL